MSFVSFHLELNGPIMRTSSLVALALLAAAGLGLAGEGSQPRKLPVSSFALGLAGGQMDAAAFAAALSADGALVGQPANAAEAWNRAGAGAKAEGRVAIVTCGFSSGRPGEGQAEAFAFQFGGADGALSRAVHIPYRQTWDWNAQGWGWVPPVGELAAWLSSLQGADQERKREPLQLAFAEWRAVEDKEEMDLDVAGTTPTIGIEAAGGASWKQAMPAVEAMSWWAAWENGLRPVGTEAAAKASVEVRMKYRKMDIRLNLTTQGGRREIFKLDVPETRFQAVLSRMFMMALKPAGIRDFGLLCDGEPMVLAADSTGVVFLASGVLARCHPVTGQRVFPPEPEEGKKPSAPPASCVRRRQNDIFRYSGQIARVHPVTGVETILSSRGAGAAWAFCALGDKSAAMVSGCDLVAQKGTEEVWKKQAAAPFTCGPVPVDGFLVAGNGAGEICAYRSADGTEAWKRALPFPIQGCLSAAGSPPRIYGCDRDTVYALSPADGSVVWSRKIGDAALTPPFACGKGILVAAKNNVVRLLAVADGQELAQNKWDTWLTSIQPLTVAGTNILVATDLDGRVAFLDPANLRVLRTVALPWPLARGTLGIKSFPVAWGSRAAQEHDEDELDKDGPGAEATTATVLVADREGFVYLLDPPGAAP